MDKRALLEIFTRTMRDNKIQVSQLDIIKVSEAYNWDEVNSFIERDISEYTKSAKSEFDKLVLNVEREQYHMDKLSEIVREISVKAARRSRLRLDSDDFVVYSHVEAISESIKITSCDYGYPCRK